MTKRKNHLPDFKANVALEAIREEMSLWRLAQVDGHAQRSDRKVALQSVTDGPADHPP